MNGTESTTFAGMNGCIWFLGVVEDINDPLKLGRVRVRVHGFHTENKTDIPTSSLPWAMPIVPVHSAALSGIGETPFGLLPGTTVVGFFADGIHAQQPILYGSINGEIDSEPNSQEGFSDPDGVYPRFNKETKRGTYPLKTDINPAALIELQAYSPTSWRINTRIREIQKAWPFEKYGEPETEAAPEYAKNHVRETQSGHVQELDDTPGHERIMEMHRSGTFREVYPDGSSVIRILGDNYEITLKDKNLVVSGDLNITVQGNVTLITNGNVDQRIKGDYNLAVDGDIRMTTKGAFGLRADREIETSSGADTTQFATGNFERKSGGTMVDIAEGLHYTKAVKVHHNSRNTPDVDEPSDAIASRRTSIPEQLILDMSPADIIENANIGTDITDRPQFNLGGEY